VGGGGGGVQTGSTRHVGHWMAYWTCPGWLWWWRIWWNENWQGKPKYSENTCPSATLSTTNPTWQIRAAAVGSQRLTAWAINVVQSVKQRFACSILPTNSRTTLFTVISKRWLLQRQRIWLRHLTTRCRLIPTYLSEILEASSRPNKIQFRDKNSFSNTLLCRLLGNICTIGEAHVLSNSMKSKRTPLYCCLFWQSVTKHYHSLFFFANSCKFVYHKPTCRSFSIIY
jgi:hypothetical protein